MLSDNVGFIIMPFHNDFLPVCAAIKTAVSEAGKGKGIRADDIYRPGNVVEQLKDAIRRADFCIADLTGSNVNVMWEVGFARALEKPVIAIRQPSSDPLPFDLRVDRTFTYELTKVDDVITTLVTAIQATVAELELQWPPTGWRYDELADLREQLSRCEPIPGERNLLNLLSTAMADVRFWDWNHRDVQKVMDCIAQVQRSKREHENAFWWLIVLGVFGYDQIKDFHYGDHVEDSIELVHLTNRGIALMKLLVDECVTSSV